ncbi:cytochrome P450 [Durotheca rogersii]|uniref:cytochrome P450 n=1 Tax=Durotheca rogersii TaxID=419775 RepID=UPI0022211F18|nr:cytochrome P450 [Durotheca rogersii]KAI5858204.1 cytochrome P450 [Durotheca rogersii]
MDTQLGALLSYVRVVPLVGGLCLLIPICFRISAWYRLRHVDGPWLASFSYLWMLAVSIGARQAASYRKLNQKYGSLVRIGPYDLLTDDPEVIKRMNGARSKYRRSSWYFASRVNADKESVFNLLDTAEHDKLKAQLSFGYGGKENPTIEDDIDGQLGELVGLIRRKYVATTVRNADGSTTELARPMDLATRIQFFTLDAITKVAYGKSFGFLASDGDVHGYIAAVETIAAVIAPLGDLPWLSPIVFSKTVLRLVGPKTTAKKGVGKLMGIARDIAEERFRPGAKDRLDMLGSFIRHGITREQCESEIVTQIIAGSDTTATSIRGTMLCLITSPLAYMRLREEIDQAIAEGRISSPIKVSEAKGLEYLQAVIYEGLRINIPFSGLTMKEVPPEGDTIDGKFIPGGTRVAHSFLSLQRSTAIYGPDSDVFRPERWLGLSPEAHRKMTQTTELVFGYGRWSCSGKHVAFLELNKAYVELLRYFDFQLVNPRNPVHTENRNMFFEKDMWVKITDRALPNPA